MDMERERGSPRLRFSKEELDHPELGKLARDADKAADIRDQAQRKLKTHRRLKLKATDADIRSSSDSAIRTEKVPDGDVPVRDPSAPAVLNTRKKQAHEKSPETISETEKVPVRALPVDDKPLVKTHSVDEAKAAIKKKTVRLQFEETKAKPPSKMHHPIERTIHTAGDQFHRQVATANEDDNAAVNAALRGQDISDSALRMGESAYHSHKLKPYRQAMQAEKKLDQANIRYLQAKAESEHPQFTSNPVSRWQQKQAIRREYAAAKRGKSASKKTAKSTEKAAQKTTEKAADVAKAAAESVAKHPTAWVIIALVCLLLVLVSGLQSCTPLAQSVLESIVIGTYPAEEADVRAAERAYAAKEKALKDEMDHYSRYHPEYDECHVDADEIWHDPYVLIAIISAYYDGQDWTIDTAMPVIEKYFALQYIVTETVTTETRYRTKYEWQYNPDTGRNEQVPVQVPYTYTICNVKLENKNLSHLPVVSMSRHGLGMYALYMATHGNMEGIFTGGHATPLRDPQLYDIPQETLDANPTFAKLMEEATKYIGYPYVWGGDSPETSFDCSGFVSYVFTNSGVYNTGRHGATGLYNLCRKVSTEDVRPGDIVFFEGTMGDDVGGITHCGIYVGNGMMIHCGSPIGYANLNDSYWRQHFHSFGRCPGL